MDHLIWEESFREQQCADLPYCQKEVFNMYPRNGHAIENISYTSKYWFTDHAGTGKMFSVPDIIPNNEEQEYCIRDEITHRNSMWMMDSSSQAYSGPEDNSDPHESLTETSTLAFVDSHTTEKSMENHSLHGVGMSYLKEFVLIDDDEDGDMSLREKTVTDMSAMDGKAAELVCGRLLSTSSGSLSESKGESLAREASSPEEKQKTVQEKKHCCFCILL